MTDTVWVSQMCADTSIMCGLEVDWPAINLDRKPRKATFERYEFKQPDQLPKVMYANHQIFSQLKLPYLFNQGYYFCVSSTCAEVLHSFDLGRGGLVPVPIFHRDRETPVGGEFFILNFGANKRAFVAAASRNLMKMPHLEGEPELWVRGDNVDGDVAVTRAALEGPDIWTDPNIHKAIFFSDRVVQALQAKKMAKRFSFLRCRIVGEA